MSKETKEDRIVRGIFDQVTEHLYDLKNMQSNSACKESDVERWCQSFLRGCLGYTASAGYVIRSQESKGKSRPDLIVSLNDKPIFVVEVKKLGFDLNKSDFRSGKVQLNEYLNQIGGVRWGMLTNGSEWKLFEFANSSQNGVEVCSIDLFDEDESIDLSKKSIEEKCYDIIDMHEYSYSTKIWEQSLKEALAFSPETLAKAILSVDVIKYISKYVKGEHEFKASHDVLTDKVYDLIRMGLDDAITGWNDSKAVEFEKYTKTQKRCAAKGKVRSKTKKNMDQNGRDIDYSTKSLDEQTVAMTAADSDVQPSMKKVV